MCTVFAILLIVIFLGKSLTAFVNKYVPEEVAPVKRDANAPAPIPANIRAAIDAAVTVVTQGKGRVAKVEKI